MIGKRLTSIFVAIVLLCSQAWATWSIVVVDLATGEVAVVTATCLTNFDLREYVPVLVPGYGAGAHQSAVDVYGTNRLINWQLLQTGTPVSEILQIIKDQDLTKHFRQIGIVSLRGDAVTFTGPFTGDWGGGSTGRVGSLVYAIQGNGLAGQRVVTMCEAALRGSTGPLPERLLAAMDAANSMGGDGRCSCSVPFPDSCGTPPPGTWKGSHVATLVLGRPGDPIESCTASGCADGDIYLALNVAYASAGDPDPLITLRQQYQTWAVAQIGRPDAYQSDVFLSSSLVNPGSGLVQLVVDLRDRDGNPLSTGGSVLSLVHDEASVGSSSLAGVTDHMDGTYTMDIQPGTKTGVDRLRVVVDDGVKPVTLWPPTELVIAAPQVIPWNNPQVDAALGFVGGARSLRLAGDGLGGWLLGEDPTGTSRIWFAQRADELSPFQSPVAQADDFGGGWDLRSVTVTVDGLHAILGAVAPGESVERLWNSTRPDNSMPFSFPVVVSELNSGSGESTPILSNDDLRLWFASSRGGFSRIWSSHRSNPGSRFLRPEPQLFAAAGDILAWPLPIESGTQLIVAKRNSSGTWSPMIADLAWPAPQLHSIPGGWPALAAGYKPTAMDSNGDLWLAGPSLMARAERADSSLTITPDSLSASVGGNISLQIDLGTAAANAPFRILVGGLGGTSAVPGIPCFVPLLVNQATGLSFNGDGLFGSGFGTLDAIGVATISLSVPAGAGYQSHWLGKDYSVCAVAAGTGQAFVSASVPFRLNP